MNPLRAFVILTIAIFVSMWAYQYHGQVIISNANKRGCSRAIGLRLIQIEVYEASIKANKAIANDPNENMNVRIAREVQYKAEQRAIINVRQAVDPYHGGTVVCSKLYSVPLWPFDL